MHNIPLDKANLLLRNCQEQSGTNHANQNLSEVGVNTSANAVTACKDICPYSGADADCALLCMLHLCIPFALEQRKRAILCHAMRRGAFQL